MAVFTLVFLVTSAAVVAAFFCWRPKNVKSSALIRYNVWVGVVAGIIALILGFRQHDIVLRGSDGAWAPIIGFSTAALAFVGTLAIATLTRNIVIFPLLSRLGSTAGQQERDQPR